MLLASPIEHQPNFPKEDLTDTNAQALCVMLSSQEMIKQGHGAAESMTKIYQLGHKAFTSAINRIYDSPTTIEAINSGITLYEAISSLVTHPPYTEEEASLILNAFGISQQISARHFDDYASEAVESLILATPRTADVVAETMNDRSGRHIARLAVVGAGMARKFELDNASL